MENKLKDRLAAGEVCIGGWLTVRSAEVAEAMASLGFDWIALDMEHGSAGVADAEAAFLACERWGCAPLVRLPGADPILARRLLDTGAHGFLVPAVDNAEAFAEFAAHCFFPPEGRRGVSLERFNLWGETFDDYIEGFCPVLVPMIESRRGVANAAAIAGLSSVDAIFFGPYDLSADLGRPGDFASDVFVAALDELRGACREAGKPVGGHQVTPDGDALAAMIADGARFIAFGTDLIAMRSALGAFRAAAGR